MSPTILVTGGAGYIGSHTVLLLLEAGYRVLVLDDLSNGSEVALTRVGELAGQKAKLIQGDIRDHVLLQQLFADEPVEAVVHFAGLKAVGESVANPLWYYSVNVGGTLSLLQAMVKAKVKRLVFSSSATVYGDPDSVPIREDAPLHAINPYGATKLHIEDILRDLYNSDESWGLALLRYFNPVGAHDSGRIGEDPHDMPNNLIPFIAQVAVGRRPELQVFGSNYNTPDGTGVRDYIHVMDLAAGHLAALQQLEQQPELLQVNLGTGQGYSVLDMVKAFEKASGREIPYRLVDRRPGDIACCYADPALARQRLNWWAQRGLDTMCTDHWRWQKNNPDGYRND